MASVRKRTWVSSGQERTAWVVDYFDQKGARRLKTCATKKAAEAFKTNCSYEIIKGIHTPESTSITVSEAVRLWLEYGEAEGLQAGTLRTYRVVAKHHVLPILGPHKLARLNQPEIERYRNNLLTGKVPDGKRRSRVMARKALGCLKAVIKDAQRSGHVAQNVAAQVTIKANRAEQRKIRPGVDFPDKAEVRAILAAAAPRWRPLIMTTVFCGLRSSELRGLRWQDVDFGARLLKVRQRADRWGHMGPTKSVAGDRDIAMAPIVLNTLREWKLACPRSELELVFPTPTGAVLDHAMVYRRAFGDVQRACGIVRPQVNEAGEPVIKRNKPGEPVLDQDTGKPIIVMVPKYGPHDFRHFCASWWIDQGFGPKRIMGTMGHASIAMTFNVYGHLFPADKEDHDKLAEGQIELVG